MTLSVISMNTETKHFNGEMSQEKSVEKNYYYYITLNRNVQFREFYFLF